MAAGTVSIRMAILEELRTKEYRPTDLLQLLSNKGYTDSDIKQALSELVREGSVEFTAQRMLKTPATQDAA
jgi:hypothetical protein